MKLSFLLLAMYTLRLCQEVGHSNCSNGLNPQSQLPHSFHVDESDIIGNASSAEKPQVGVSALDSGMHKVRNSTGLSLCVVDARPVT